MGGGKGKKDVNAKLTTKFFKHTEIQNKPPNTKINRLVCKIDSL
jgi:hypothetical protein